MVPAGLAFPAGLAALGAAVAYDSRRNEIVLFGGRAQDDYLSDTWVWSPGGWTRRAPPSSPSPRMNVAMAFDARRGRVVLFGGRNGAELLADTWEWDGETWRTIATTEAPEPRAESAMVFDEGRSRLVLYGGHSPNTRRRADATGRANTVIAYGDMWELDGATWQRIEPLVPAAEAGADPPGSLPDSADADELPTPGARAWHAMAYDAANGRIVLFGGRNGMQNFLSDTWAFEGRRWTRLTSDFAPIARTAAALVFDRRLGALLLAGGVVTGSGVDSLADDAWTLSGSDWAPFDLAATAHPRGALVGAYLDDAETTALFAIRESTDADASRVVTRRDRRITAVDSTEDFDATETSTSPSARELLADESAQYERWLAIAEDTRATVHRRWDALSRVVDSLRSATPDMRRRLGARALASAMAEQDATTIYELLATPREWLASEEAVEPILAEIALLADTREVRCRRDVFARLASGLRVRLVAHGLAPRGATFTEDDLLDPRFDDTNVMRDAMIYAVGRRDRAAARSLAARILPLDPLDGFALVVAAALDGDASGDVLTVLDAYFATVTQVHGACLESESVARVSRYADAHPSPWVSFALESVGSTFQLAVHEARSVTMTRDPIDPRGGLVAVAGLLRTLSQSRSISRDAADSAFFAASMPPSVANAAPRISPRVDVPCRGISGARTWIDTIVHYGVYDDAIAGMLEFDAIANFDSAVCVARSHGAPRARLFDALARMRWAHAPRAATLAALVDEDPVSFTPFARAFLRAANAEGFELTDSVLRRVTAIDPYHDAHLHVATPARGVDAAPVATPDAGVVDAPSRTTVASQLLDAVVAYTARRYRQAAVAFESLARETSEPSELRALAGIAFALAGDDASLSDARRLGAVLAHDDPTSARHLAIEEALAGPGVVPRPLASYFPEPLDSSRRSSGAIPHLGLHAPFARCHLARVGANYGATSEARLVSFAELLDRTTTLEPALRNAIATWFGESSTRPSLALVTASTSDGTPDEIRCALAIVAREHRELADTNLTDDDVPYTYAPDIAPCARVTLGSESSIRSLAHAITHGTDLLDPARYSEFVRATDARPVERSSFDVLEARVLALGALGRDAAAAELRLALMALGVAVPIDAAALRSSARLHASYASTDPEAARLAFVEGESRSAEAAAMRIGCARIQVETELRDGTLTRTSRLAMMTTQPTLADYVAALEASPRSTVTFDWVWSRRNAAGSSVDRTRLRSLLDGRLRDIVRTNPSAIRPYALEMLDPTRDRALLRLACRAFEASVLEEDPDDDPVDVLLEVYTGYRACAPHFRTHLEEEDLEAY